MNKEMLGTNSIEQIAFVVNDIDQAITSFSNLLGISQPEWFLTGAHDRSRVFYKGEPSDTQSKLVFIDTPSVQIELMEVNDEPSTMKDYLNENGEGIHHLAFVVDKISPCLEPLAKRGYPLLQSGEFTSVNKGRYAYLDTEARMKIVFELLERETPQPKKVGDLIGEPLFSSRTFTQIAFVVEDIDESAARFGELLDLKIPPKIKSEAPEVTQVAYKGKATEADAVFMSFKTPTLEVELIQPRESPSIWKDHLEKYGEGIHHIALELDNLEERLPGFQKKGFDVIQQGKDWHGKYAYLDTKEEFKVTIKLLERQAH
ncbi:VOC family protein [Sporosarcina soli]|uniref:VOC family protein n=1 Tax=Sporosarcina soli TaxID=334736 RepID=A0ABW0TF44_9BACL